MVGLNREIILIAKFFRSMVCFVECLSKTLLVILCSRVSNGNEMEGFICMLLCNKCQYLIHNE